MIEGPHWFLRLRLLDAAIHPMVRTITLLGLTCGAVLHYQAARNTAYPIEACLDFKQTNPNRLMIWLSHDTAFMHAVMATESALQDSGSLRPLTKTTYFHLRRALTLLNPRLTHSDAYLSDAIAWIVMALAIVASILNDHLTASTHLAGLQDVVRLRGGFASIDPKLQFKIDRLVSLAHVQEIVLIRSAD